ncbi:substrate-binding periplasmic protein [Alkalimarinus coralli]|uniref:substrate-binding periplasmic protein n=1 Tax=Alkalimarinus coralli TaxID=2935863 RepID=UPI00202B2B29|nr:transporter substrate-binding domain-containing protein [Alkalimarinus coralli]
MMNQASLRTIRRFITLSLITAILLYTSFAYANARSSWEKDVYSPAQSKPGYTETITVSTGEWAPFISEKKIGYGPISMVVSEAFALSGVKVKYRFFPWKRAMQELRSKRVVASSAWRATDERQQEFLFSDGVYDNQNVFFHLKSTPFDWNKLSDLKRYYVGAALGYAYSEEFEKAEERGDFDVFRVNKEKSLVEMLLTQRIDVFPANREVGLQLIRQQAPEAFDQFAIHPKPISINPLRLIFNQDKKGAALLKKFNAGLQRIKQSGRYAEIYGSGS